VATEQGGQRQEEPENAKQEQRRRRMGTSASMVDLRPERCACRSVGSARLSHICFTRLACALRAVEHPVGM
jgi:hypothetical protein